MLRTAFLTLVLGAVALASPIFEGLGNHRRPITTASPEAQRYFDQGLAWTFAFNHDEAIRSFTEAARLDPSCAMAYWGIAYCHGPHINNPAMTEERTALAWEASQKALSLSKGAMPAERFLIQALATRYAAPPVTDRAPLDIVYAAAMRKVWLEYGGDPDIAHLYAESLMNLQPWDLWTPEGAPKGRTTEILALLEETIARSAHHAGAHHLYIHCVEASPFPEKGIPSANFLRDAFPGSGHLTHMPAHIDVQTGQWAKASLANEKAIEVDRAYRRISPQQGFYRLYMLHNHHFLSWSAMMQGRSEVAIRAAREMVETIPPEFSQANAALVDAYAAIPYEALMRFGRWDDLLAEVAPAEYLPITTALWRFSRAIALGAKGETQKGRGEQTLFRAAVAKVAPDANMAINPAHNVLKIADLMLEGELCFREGRSEESVKALREAVALEDALTYMEPPDWIQPVRHTLGAVLVKAGRLDEAEAVYRADLKVWPGNGWSLFGLWQVAVARKGDASKAKAEFEAAWSEADIEICATCLCVPMDG